MDGLLTFEHGEVRLGSVMVPGVLKSIRVRGAVVFDEAETDGLSGKTKTPKGWDDSAISITVALVTDTTTCYHKLAQINTLFRRHDIRANPLVLDVANPHITARGVERVVFCGLMSAESNKDDVIVATLDFTEHRPPIVVAEKSCRNTSGYIDPEFAEIVKERCR